MRSSDKDEVVRSQLTDCSGVERKDRRGTLAVCNDRNSPFQSLFLSF